MSNQDAVLQGVFDVVAGLLFLYQVFNGRWQNLQQLGLAKAVEESRPFGRKQRAAWFAIAVVYICLGAYRIAKSLLV
ncbi:MAG TPA: hypothetical protein VFA76_05365 [Terriglobales bacterium]|nr:hypothetical protein [Terriglobales bacterium]